ncbi:UNVERIFIED_CONTAM: hypothetical protein RMT77_010365 [Armadillidium vulgare]
MFPLIILISCQIISICFCQSCPPTYEEHPLVLVSLDGFRAEYLSRGLTPNLQKLIDGGASTPYMRSSYPTITFPNHYSIVTGLYPETHGIIDNHFYDPDFDAYFDLGSEESLNGRWWGGEPIWNTVIKQGKLSATMFWPGSDADIEGMRPTYYYVYDTSVPYDFRVNQILEWLALPVDERPSFLCLYFDEPDHTGHEYGPDTSEIDAELPVIDSYIGDLVNGIAALNLTDCVNLIIVSDHGMTTVTEDRSIELDTYVPDLSSLASTYEGVLVRIRVNEEDEDKKYEIRKNLTCQLDEMLQYDAIGIPKRHHFSNNDRIGDIVVKFTLGYMGNVDDHWYLSGEHGYDNLYDNMRAIFIASGPDFQSGGAKFEPFQNIELYNLMCELLGVEPAINNGTEASIYDLLLSPPQYPTIDPEDPAEPAPFPSEDEIDERINLSGCPGDASSPLDLNFTEEEENDLASKHLPWGVPHSGNLAADFTLLYQNDHVTGYSQSLKLPLWTSFTLTSLNSEPPLADWSSDVRLTSSNTQTCSAYDDLKSLNVTMQPLFPNFYGSNAESSATTFIISNSVPFNDQLSKHWNHLTENLIPSWLNGSSSGLNIIIGPAFDKDADSVVDDYNNFQSNPAVPSHLFLIVTKCSSSVTEINDCPTSDLDSLAFIFLQYYDISNCLNENDFSLENSAKVKDVERLTGLTFFPNLPYKDRTKLVIRIHASLWQ